MKDIIETLHPMNRLLLGAGYDSALEFLKHLVKLDVIEIPSGTEFGTWTVPDEWIIREAWIKGPDETKILDYAKDPMCLMLYSQPVHEKMSLEEVGKKINTSDKLTSAIPHSFSFYEKKWGFNARKSEIMTVNTDAMAGVRLENGEEFVPKYKLNLPEGEYEIFIDSEFKPGVMKIGVHTIKGKTDREILLFAHLDHPFQSNDNLSSVACLMNLIGKIKSEYTIKIIFCPETIGSIGYAFTQDISKVDWVLGLECCGNNNEHTLQMSFKTDRVNDAFRLALTHNQESFKLGKFRNLIGSDEYIFNDPLIDIPGVLLTRWPFPEYHTSEDTPDKINYEKLEQTGKIIMKAIEIYEKDFTPVKKFKGPLMRSKYQVQTGNPQMNLAWDYIVYKMDGTQSLAQLCIGYGVNFDLAYEVMLKLENDGKICRINDSEGKKQKTPKKKSKRV